jgi:DNA replication protein DnaC
MYGSNGTQKTTLAKWMAAKLLSNGYSVRYSIMQNLIKDLTIFEDEEREQACAKYYGVDLLIIDEVFDKSKVTLYKSGYQIPFLDQFIRDRLDNHKKGIVFVSNKKIEEIDAQGFGISLQDLITRKVLLKKSLLTFEDKYFSEVNLSAIKGIFD